MAMQRDQQTEMQTEMLSEQMTESRTDQTKGRRSEPTTAWPMEPPKEVLWVSQALSSGSQTERTWALWEPASKPMDARMDTEWGYPQRRWEPESETTTDPWEAASERRVWPKAPWTVGLWEHQRPRSEPPSEALRVLQMEKAMVQKMGKLRELLMGLQWEHLWELRTEKSRELLLDQKKECYSASPKETRWVPMWAVSWV